MAGDFGSTVDPHYAPAMQGTFIRVLVATALVPAALGCGARSPGPARDDLDTVADRIAGLPAPTRSLGLSSERFREAWAVAEIALDEPLPLPQVADEALYVEWLGAELAPWLRQRARTIERLESVARLLRAETVEEHTTAIALVAHLFEDTARQVLIAEVPRDPARPGREAELRAALRDRLEPLLDKALERYRRCLLASRAPPLHLHGWRAFCEARARALEAD